MLFNSFVFLFLFLPITLLGYFIIGKYHIPSSKAWLLIASLFFYSYWAPEYLPLVIVSMVVNFFIGTFLGKEIKPHLRKPMLVLGIVLNVALLGYYKYFDFFISTTNDLLGMNLPLQHLLLPLAISFYTFTQIAYLVDSYRHETKVYNFLNYGLFVTFFPHLIAGPIVFHKQLAPQFNEKKTYAVDFSNIAKGLFIFVIGLAKKVAIADTVAVWANDGFANYTSLSFTEAWVTSLSYTTQLYFDFSGYCDMAIGLALLFNIKLPINFYSPYKARNIQEFWRKWHMTLNEFLTNYLYFPLGGSKKGVVRTYINILIIFFVSGFWHGAGWTFIVWGMLHGIASVIVRLWGKTKIQLPYVISWLMTFLFVNFAWVYFRATSMEQAHTILLKMVTPDWSSLQLFFTQPLANFVQSSQLELFNITLSNPYVIVTVLLAALIISFIAKNSIELLNSFTFSARHIVYTQTMIALVLLTVFYFQKNSVFLYFNF